MNLEDAVALDWMAGFTRTPLPQRVAWQQSNVTHTRFYWLAMPEGQPKGGQIVIATRHGQEFQIDRAEKVNSLTILLNDAMADLDKPVTITMSGEELFKDVAPRTIQQLHSTMAERGDPFLTFSAAVTVKIPAK